MLKKIFIKIFILISIPMNSQSIDLVNPNDNIGIENWIIVNDDVMGGISKSKLYIDNYNNLVFNGYLSLENNGGFASCRLNLNGVNLDGIKSFSIKYRGDGNIYKLRLQQSNRRASYSIDFKSKKDQWQEVNLSIKDFIATWRGFTYSDYPEIELDKINSLGIQISNKQEGNFKLEIKNIKVNY